jgi:hypothetical protein
MGRILLDAHRERGGDLGGLARPARLRRYIRRRLRTTTQNVKRWGLQLLPTYRRVYPLILLAATASWIGAWYEILRPGVGKLRLLREAHAIFASSGATRRTTARGSAR